MNPRLLLLEDDVVSARFLHEALAVLPVRVDHAPDLATARRLARADDGLWLFDQQLPDGRGDQLLAELRDRGLGVAALALTADDTPATRRRLLAAGFDEVLCKPLPVARLRVTVQARLPGPATPWDDAVALAALGGQAESVRVLRRLFLEELPGQRRELADACRRGDEATARALLHRLTASCGFVGATPLLDAVRALHGRPADAGALRRFETLAAELLAAGPA